MLGRKVLQVHRCTGSEVLLGNANVSGSIFALLLVGFVVGIIAGAALMACCRRRQKTVLTCEQRFNSPEAPTPGNDYTHQGVKHKKTQSALIRDDAVRRSGVTGPLGVGIVLQSIDIPKENREPGSLATKLQRPSIDAWSNVDLTSEQNCNQNGPALKENYANPHHTGPQQGDKKAPHLALGNISRGTIKAGWGRTTDRDSSVRSAADGIGAMSIREAAAAARAAPIWGRSGAHAKGKAAPPPPPPPPGANPSARPAPPSHDAAKNQGQTRERSSSGAAQAQAPNLAQQAAEAGAELRRRAEEQKQKAAAEVAPAYDLDDLDDEWKALLNELEDRLYQGGKQGMDAEDRAVAIRSLLVSTARETPEAALAQALDDIDRHRRSSRR
ncbi:g11477 [Coccomyxa elongata]